MAGDPAQVHSNVALEIGATFLEDGRCQFLVWAPRAKSVELRLLPSNSQGKQPGERIIAMKPLERGYYQTIAEDVDSGRRYVYRLNGGKERPDPASRFQPEGVHGPSQAIPRPTTTWDRLSWAGRPLDEYVLYELHVGIFTPEGTFDAIIPRLDELSDLGITAIELMPVAQFPGDRNWGYDGVCLFAVQDSYGGPEGLRRLVRACHERGMAVVLDVVYNHLGPEGNYLAEFGPYFTDAYRTPWGPAINYDGSNSDEVRRFFLGNALYWTQDFHVDALRLDAIHAIMDVSAQPFLEELGSCVHEKARQLGRHIYVIAESDSNDPRAIRPLKSGGLGLDAQWNDDFHHALHALLTAEQSGYYRDFGTLGQMAQAFTEGFVLTGQYSAFRRRRHGCSSRDIPSQRFVVCTQNHDQVGNRRLGERLSRLVSLDDLKLASGVLLLAPFIPLLFMGEEYGETAPFQYFVSYSDPAVIQAVREGRREEFAAFDWAGEVPDPQDVATFLRSKLHWELQQQGHHRVLRDLYRELIGLRRELPALARLSKEAMQVAVQEKATVVSLHRWNHASQIFALFHFGTAPAKLTLRVPPGDWQKRLDSSEPRWCGNGSSLPHGLCSDSKEALTLSPRSFALYIQPASAKP
jgi:maltooligosyltrehalose trehalohydrolase